MCNIYDVSNINNLNSSSSGLLLSTVLLPPLPRRDSSGDGRTAEEQLGTAAILLFFPSSLSLSHEKWIKEAFGERNGLSEQEKEFRSLAVQSSTPRRGNWRLSIHALGQNADTPRLGMEAYA
ncbi:hypothetical protein PIB30_061290 [Stylosanthes scabra]|uniref:Uncharacterized protein n=1 Tax=Stylosanthes scabra TaxID=79078 RepID=A0ABU6WKN1_9FABA|nr:hypothetical protein [Stylosanthes scabra]